MCDARVRCVRRCDDCPRVAAYGNCPPERHLVCQTVDGNGKSVETEILLIRTVCERSKKTYLLGRNGYGIGKQYPSDGLRAGRCGQ